MSVSVVLLVEESAAMDSSLDKTASKSKSESVATAINALFNKLKDVTDLELALVGYRSDREGNADVGCRWQGALTGRDFVPGSELAVSPALVEQRVKKIPTPYGMPEEQTVEFPVWYQPQLGDKAPQIAAFQYCQQLLSQKLASAGDVSGPPLVIHLSAGPSGDGNPRKAVESLQQLASPAGSPLVLQAHLTSSFTVPATVYPANRAFVAIGAQRDLFERSSVLPEHLAKALKEAKVNVNPKARGMVYNAQMPDVTRLLNLTIAHAACYAKPVVAVTSPASADTVADFGQQPAPVSAPDSLSAPDALGATSELQPAAYPDAMGDLDSAFADLSPADLDSALPADDAYAPQPDPVPATFQVLPGSVSAHQPALVLFVLDRSVEDPYSGNLKNACSQLQDQMGDLLEQIVKNGEGAIDVGVVTYGATEDGELDVRTQLEGGLSGRAYARDSELSDGAIRVDSFVEEISNGVGGLLTIQHERPVLVEIEPAWAAATERVFSEVANLLSSWSDQNPTSALPPLVLHLTRGRQESLDREAAASVLAQVATPCGQPVTLYHLVVTEEPHPTVRYPDQPDALETHQLQDLWRVSSPLLCADQLAEEKPGFSLESRGFVVNGKFNLLLDAIKRGLADD